MHCDGPHLHGFCPTLVCGHCGKNGHAQGRCPDRPRAAQTPPRRRTSSSGSGGEGRGKGKGNGKGKGSGRGKGKGDECNVAFDPVVFEAQEFRFLG